MRRLVRLAKQAKKTPTAVTLISKRPTTYTVDFEGMRAGIIVETGKKWKYHNATFYIEGTAPTNDVAADELIRAFKKAVKAPYDLLYDVLDEHTHFTKDYDAAMLDYLIDLTVKTALEVQGVITNLTQRGHVWADQLAQRLAPHVLTPSPDMIGDIKRTTNDFMNLEKDVEAFTREAVPVDPTGIELGRATPIVGVVTEYEDADKLLAATVQQAKEHDWFALLSPLLQLFGQRVAHAIVISNDPWHASGAARWIRADGGDEKTAELVGTRQIAKTDVHSAIANLTGRTWAGYQVATVTPLTAAQLKAVTADDFLQHILEAARRRLGAKRILSARDEAKAAAHLAAVEKAAALGFGRRQEMEEFAEDILPEGTPEEQAEDAAVIEKAFTNWLTESSTVLNDLRRAKEDTEGAEKDYNNAVKVKEAYDIGAFTIPKTKYFVKASRYGAPTPNEVASELTREGLERLRRMNQGMTMAGLQELADNLSISSWRTRSDDYRAQYDRAYEMVVAVMQRLGLRAPDATEEAKPNPDFPRLGIGKKRTLSERVSRTLRDPKLFTLLGIFTTYGDGHVFSVDELAGLLNEKFARQVKMNEDERIIAVQKALVREARTWLETEKRQQRIVSRGGGMPRVPGGLQAPRMSKTVLGRGVEAEEADVAARIAREADEIRASGRGTILYDGLSKKLRKGDVVIVEGEEDDQYRVTDGKGSVFMVPKEAVGVHKAGGTGERKVARAQRYAAEQIDPMSGTPDSPSSFARSVGLKLKVEHGADAEGATELAKLVFDDPDIQARIIEGHWAGFKDVIAQVIASELLDKDQLSIADIRGVQDELKKRFR